MYYTEHFIQFRVVAITVYSHACIIIMIVINTSWMFISTQCSQEQLTEFIMLITLHTISYICLIQLYVQLQLARASPIMLMHAWLYTRIGHAYTVQLYVDESIIVETAAGCQLQPNQSLCIHNQQQQLQFILFIAYLEVKKCMVKLYLLIWSN